MNNPKQRFLWKNKENYPKIILKYTPSQIILKYTPYSVWIQLKDGKAEQVSDCNWRS